MKLEQHVLSAIDDYEAGNPDAALMNTCIAIESTARNLYKKDEPGAKGYKDCIQKYYWIIEPMIGEGLNLEETKWDNVNIYNGRGRKIQNPDLADIVYHIFRCNDAHGKPVPKNYRLLPVADGYSTWLIADGIIHMPERIIWALLAVSVFSSANMGIKSEGDYYLSYGSETLGMGVEKFVIKDWWGKENEFKSFLSNQNIIRVKLGNLSFKKT